jgi:hypothetical protein
VYLNSIPAVTSLIVVGQLLPLVAHLLHSSYGVTDPNNVLYLDGITYFNVRIYYLSFFIIYSYFSLVTQLDWPETSTDQIIGRFLNNICTGVG